MITITPPLPLTDIDPASPHLSSNHRHGRLVPVDVVFHLETDDRPVATALTWVGPEGGDVFNPAAEVRRIMRLHPDHTFAGTITFPAEVGEVLLVTVADGILTDAYQPYDPANALHNPREAARA
ncbi:hypothetical protein ETD86_37350 [Nonomuraea turkmeniaca]|uniref:Uncharacterized protein n=1 Tax=Nonomuraea turkmeniaca TaxID=103838 RepID=A0A5S4FP89_9ACTN|nr:hypothetical protein [Nonomuraea turkmeniaca]TMR10985.1 hypothetical protein ETD86_37350 [Nonomuraea turkmeniaca]